MKINILILIFLSITIKLYSQQQISGYVRDSESGEALIGATIADPNFRTGTATNAYGYFSLDVSDSVKNIIVSFVGYESQNLEIGNEKILNVKLSPTSDEISEIEVVRSAPARLSMERLSARTVSKLPVVLGESDITRTVQMLPGVTPGTEATSGYFVRGGDADQNLLLIDGTPVYNAYHMFGLFSVFNSDAVNDARFYKGSIPVSYGGSLSSVMDISLREGNANRLSGEIGIGTFTSKFLLEGPIIKDRTSFLVTARRSMLDKQPEKMQKLTKNVSGMREARGSVQHIDEYGFWDVNAKLNHRFSERSQLFVSYYSGKDDYSPEPHLEDESHGVIDSNPFYFQNRTVSARYNQIITNNLYANIILYGSKYEYKNSRNDLEEYKGKTLGSKLENISGIDDYSTKIDFTQMLNRQTLNYGFQFNHQKINPKIEILTANEQSTYDTTISFDYDWNNYAIYISDKIQLTEKFDLTLGIRGDATQVDKKSYFEPQPRVLVNYRLPMDVTAKASYSRTAQNLHKLSLTSNGAPSDLWVSSTENYRPSTADEVVLGFGIPFFQKRFLFTIEGYYKQMHNLLMYSEGVSYNSGDTDWQQMVESGNGKSQGVEFCLKKEHGKTSGWISYTLSKTTRQFDNINLGREFPFTFDRRHNIAAAVMHQLGKHWNFGANWIYMTGSKMTVYSATRENNIPWDIYHNGTNIQSCGYVIYSKKNSVTLPPTHRLDACFTYTKKFKLFDAKIDFGAYNVYGRHNPYYIENVISDKEYEIVSIFSVVPYLTLGLKF